MSVTAAVVQAEAERASAVRPASDIRSFRRNCRRKEFRISGSTRL